MEPKVYIPLYRQIIATVLSAALVIAVIAGVFITLNSQNGDAIVMSYTSSLASAAPEAQSAPTEALLDPNSEVRGVWIATVDNINFPSKAGLSAAELKAELDDIVATTKAASLNAIYFQVRPTCDALYDSSYFPLSTFMVNNQNEGFPDGFDPFAYLIETAHAQQINVHAWVNPLRVTFGTAAEPAHDLSKLGAINPARRHPEWTVAYDDGKVYFNAGLPEVRKLIANGVEEIAAKYDVDGIIFDDYFYPYPVSGAEFDDADTYAKYGAGMTLDDWRRENVNKMIEQCYKAIKATDADCQFGIAPFGIWQNDDGENGGSDTNGFNSYSKIYCDALAWIKGGYIDYISPQLYWPFSQQNARFDVLCRWWNAVCDGSGVDLIISHGAYRSADWGSDTEILKQIEYARSEISYKGSIFYGYAAIKENVQNLQGQLCDAYSEDIIYIDAATNGAEIVVASPVNGSKLSLDATYLIGSSDPAYPLLLDGKPISRTKQGYFSAYIQLEKGENTFTFTQNGKTTEYKIYNKIASEQSWAKMDKFEIRAVVPANDYTVEGGETLALSLTAPSGADVTATLGGVTVKLEQATTPPDDAVYMATSYKGVIKLPSVAVGATQKLGTIEYKAVRGEETAVYTGASISVSGAGTICAVEVINDDSELKVATDSWYYDDYTSAPKGMRDMAVRLVNGYYKLRMGGYISKDNVKVIDGSVKVAAWVTSADLVVRDNKTELLIKAGENIPLNGSFGEDGRFVVTLYNVASDMSKVKTAANPLFGDAEVGKGPQTNSLRIYLTLKDSYNFYGFEYRYENGYIVVSFRNPSKLADGDLPLIGKTIVIDAGHGGDETGADSPLSGVKEKQINLQITRVLAEKLRNLGANVIETRTDDSTVLIGSRLTLLNEIEPDLCISVHQNSMGMSSDITKINGLLGLYFAESGRLATSCISSALADELNRYERAPASQRLAMVRNPKFPSTLIEVSFLTCVEEFEMMSTDAGIQKSAAGIAQGVLDFYAAQEKFIG